LYYRKEGTLPLILILGGLAALGWATAIVLYVLGLCRAAARGDRAIVRRRMLEAHRSGFSNQADMQRRAAEALAAANRRRG